MKKLSGKIQYITADEGGLRMMGGFSRKHLKDPNYDAFRSSDPIELAEFIYNNGIDENCCFPSSMDFAKENGFDTNDGAKKLFDHALSICRKMGYQAHRDDFVFNVSGSW